MHGHLCIHSRRVGSALRQWADSPTMTEHLYRCLSWYPVISDLLSYLMLLLETTNLQCLATKKSWRTRNFYLNFSLLIQSRYQKRSMESMNACPADSRLHVFSRYQQHKATSLSLLCGMTCTAKIRRSSCSWHWCQSLTGIWLIFGHAKKCSQISVVSH